MLNIKEDILKNAGNQTVDGPHRISFHTTDDSGDQQSFLGELFLWWQNFHFWVNYPFKLII